MKRIFFTLFLSFFYLTSCDKNDASVKLQKKEINYLRIQSVNNKGEVEYSPIEIIEINY